MVGTADDAVGATENLDRRALTQKLRVRRHIEWRFGTNTPKDFFHLPARPHRHRRFSNNDRIALQCCSDLFRRLEHVSEIGVPIATPRRRAYGDEYRVC